MANHKLFPSGIALDQAFCGRQTERAALKQVILEINQCGYIATAIWQNQPYKPSD